MSTRLCAALAIALVVALPTSAIGEPLRLNTGATCTTRSGTELTVEPKSVVVTEQDWIFLDQEIRRLQGQEIKLRAENERLIELDSPWPAWYTIAITFAVGTAAGVAWSR
jgi:hypothetical protein